MLLCGLWNLFATYGSWSMTFGFRSREPLGVVHLGPLYTLHTPDGKPINQPYWYDPDYTGGVKLFNPQGGWLQLEKHRRWAMRCLRHVPFHKELRQLIVRYAAALSRADQDAAFLQMWSILETITHTGGRKYDETIRRSTWILEDADRARESLEYLRCYRNQYVHAARSAENRDQIAQLMKSYVDPHLITLLRNEFDVANLEEHGSCLSLPTSIDELKRRRRRFARAINIRTSWSRTR